MSTKARRNATHMKHTTTIDITPLRSLCAVLPAALARRLRFKVRPRVEFLGESRHLRKNDISSCLTVELFADDLPTVNRATALILLQVGGRASVYDSKNLGPSAYLVLPDRVQLEVRHA